MMDKLTQINKAERELHAAKGRLRELRQMLWVSENILIQNKKTGNLYEEIESTEAEIKQYRQTLKELY